jgi:hypothetical protein
VLINSDRYVLTVVAIKPRHYAHAGMSCVDNILIRDLRVPLMDARVHRDAAHDGRLLRPTLLYDKSNPTTSNGYA